MTLTNHMTCQVCRERINFPTEQYVADRPLDRIDTKVWHYACMPLDLVASGEQSIMEEYAMGYYAWHVQKLLHENGDLRQRTGALLRELQRQMKAKGATNEEMEDLLDDYYLRNLEGEENNSRT